MPPGGVSNELQINELKTILARTFKPELDWSANVTLFAITNSDRTSTHIPEITPENTLTLTVPKTGMLTAYVLYEGGDGATAPQIVVNGYAYLAHTRSKNECAHGNAIVNAGDTIVFSQVLGNTHFARVIPFKTIL